MMKVVDLAEFTSPGVRVYAGRDRGREVRAAAGLADADDRGESVLVKIPMDLFSLTTSFFLGMFAESVRKLGEGLFLERYKFEGPGIETVIRDGIADALLVSSPLPSTGEHPTRPK